MRQVESCPQCLYRLGCQRIMARSELDLCLLGSVPWNSACHLQLAWHKHETQYCGRSRPSPSQSQGTASNGSDILPGSYRMDHLPSRNNEGCHRLSLDSVQLVALRLCRKPGDFEEPRPEDNRFFTGHVTHLRVDSERQTACFAVLHQWHHCTKCMAPVCHIPYINNADTQPGRNSIRVHLLPVLTKTERR